MVLLGDIVEVVGVLEFSLHAIRRRQKGHQHITRFEAFSLPTGYAVKVRRCYKSPQAAGNLFIGVVAISLLNRRCPARVMKLAGGGGGGGGGGRGGRQETVFLLGVLT